MTRPGSAASSASPLTIRPMLADDDIDAELDLRHRAFGPMDHAAGEYWRAEVLACVADGRQFGVWDDGRLVGAGRFYDLRQWWRGRALPMAGVAGIKVAPEVRGKGVGKALMTAMLGAMADRGYPLSVLYPATAHLYRALGWELAGGRYIAEVPGRSLGSLLPRDPEIPEIPETPETPVEPADVTGSAISAGSAGAATGPAQPGVRRAGPDDADEVIALLGAVHAAARDCGPCTFDPGSVRRWLSDPGVFGYLARDGF
ncbi:MAG TPA: GNAT family N-acetyltransferase, partial [Streptosporangiaceae bacterium]